MREIAKDVENEFTAELHNPKKTIYNRLSSSNGILL